MAYFGFCACIPLVRIGQKGSRECYAFPWVTLEIWGVCSGLFWLLCVYSNGENTRFIEPNINEEKVVQSNVLRKSGGTSPKTKNSSVPKSGGKLPTVNCSKQSKLAQAKAKCIENVKLN